MFGKLPPKLSIPIFYILTTFVFLYKFLFGSIYGIFITCVVLYYLSEYFLGISPLGFDGLILWIMNQSETTKAAILGAFITVIGFMIAYATATSNWKSQLLANLKIQAANELGGIFSECSKLASDCKIYAISLVKAKTKIQEGCSIQEAGFLASFNREQGARFQQNRERFNSLVIEGHRLIGKHGSLLISVPSLKAGLDSAMHSLKIISDELWILVPFSMQNDLDPVRSFVEQIDETKCNELINTVNKNGLELNISYGSVNGILMSTVVSFDFWKLFFIYKERKLFTDTFIKRYKNLQKND